MTQSRRAFLKQTSALATVGVLTHIPLRTLWGARAVDIFPEQDETLLRELALIAVDAARAAGAGFADVRVSTGRRVMLFFEHFTGSGLDEMQPPALLVTTGYGVRALLDGAWGFAGGHGLTPDEITAVARAAVAEAKSNRPRRARTLELAPTPVVRPPRWVSAIEQDPFTVPLKEQADLALAALATGRSVAGLERLSLTFRWVRSNRVFASTEGSLIIQQLELAYPTGSVRAYGKPGEVDSVQTAGASLRSGSYGYEALSGIDVGTAMREAAERAVALAVDMAKNPPTSVEVGRYDVVLARQALGSALVSTLAPALNLERALGYQANQGGTSFAAPPEEMLGSYQVGSKLLTVSGDRSQPRSPATVGWDDEGVKPEEYTFVRHGVIMDYHTNRQMGPRLRGWYERRREPVRSHGCAALVGSLLPILATPNLRVTPGAGNTTVEDLIADTKRGFYIRSASGGSDQQYLNTQFGVGASAAQEIVNGKLGGYVRDFAFQFITPQFWKSLDALGGEASMGQQKFISPAPDPDRMTTYIAVQSVPARFREVNVINTGRTA